MSSDDLYEWDDGAALSFFEEDAVILGMAARGASYEEIAAYIGGGCSKKIARALVFKIRRKVFGKVLKNRNQLEKDGVTPSEVVDVTQRYRG